MIGVTSGSTRSIPCAVDLHPARQCRGHAGAVGQRLGRRGDGAELHDSLVRMVGDHPGGRSSWTWTASTRWTTPGSGWSSARPDGPVRPAATSWWSATANSYVGGSPSPGSIAPSRCPPASSPRPRSITSPSRATGRPHLRRVSTPRAPTDDRSLRRGSSTARSPAGRRHGGAVLRRCRRRRGAPHRPGAPRRAGRGRGLVETGEPFPHVRPIPLGASWRCAGSAEPNQPARAARCAAAAASSGGEASRSTASRTQDVS